MINQNKIHNKCFSKDQKERIDGLRQLEENFSLLPDREQAWNDLHKLTTDQDGSVRTEAGYTIYNLFSHLPHKQYLVTNLVSEY